MVISFFFLICYIPGIFIHIKGIRDLARYAMSSCCVGEMMSSKLRDCDFCLDESQVLNCVHFMFLLCLMNKVFIKLCCKLVACVNFKTMLSYFHFKT
ncbi:hypothetical protein Hanom_Chr14g01268191 [Helianthus anomalus]